MRAIVSDAPRMPFIGTSTLSELDAILVAFNPKLRTSELHALFLGALTAIVPQQPLNLLGKIFGDDVDLASSERDTRALFGALFGYWNLLIEQRDAGHVMLAPLKLREGASRSELRDYAKRRFEELRWYVRGIDSGGDEPSKFGAQGQEILERIAEASAYLRAYDELMGRHPDAPLDAPEAARKNLIMLVAAVEALIADLMMLSDQVRRAGRKAFSSAPRRLSRNAPCPCGSDKPWKNCCGHAEPLH